MWDNAELSVGSADLRKLITPVALQGHLPAGFQRIRGSWRRRWMEALFDDRLSLASLAEDVALLIGGAVAFVTPEFRLLACANGVGAKLDGVRQSLLRTGTAPEQLLSFFVETGIWNYIHAVPEPLWLSPRPELAFCGRISCALHAENRHVGDLVIVHEKGVLAMSLSVLLHDVVRIGSLLVAQELGARDFCPREMRLFAENVGRTFLGKGQIALASLREHDERNSTELVRTLFSYLAHIGHPKRAAFALGVHRNTLAYRLRRIRTVTGLDLDDATTRLELGLAARSIDADRRCS